MKREKQYINPSDGRTVIVEFSRAELKQMLNALIGEMEAGGIGMTIELADKLEKIIDEALEHKDEMTDIQLIDYLLDHDYLGEVTVLKTWLASEYIYNSITVNEIMEIRRATGRDFSIEGGVFKFERTDHE